MEKIRNGMLLAVVTFYFLVSILVVAQPVQAGRPGCKLNKKERCVWVGPNPRKMKCRKVVESNGTVVCRAL